VVKGRKGEGGETARVSNIYHCIPNSGKKKKGGKKVLSYFVFEFRREDPLQIVRTSGRGPRLARNIKERKNRAFPHPPREEKTLTSELWGTPSISTQRKGRRRGEHTSALTFRYKWEG